MRRCRLARRVSGLLSGCGTRSEQREYARQEADVVSAMHLMVPMRSCMLPNGVRLSCGLRRPQSRLSRSLSGGRRTPTASSAWYPIARATIRHSPGGRAGRTNTPVTSVRTAVGAAPLTPRSAWPRNTTVAPWIGCPSCQVRTAPTTVPVDAAGVTLRQRGSWPTRAAAGCDYPGEHRKGAGGAASVLTLLTSMWCRRLTDGLWIILDNKSCQ
jgi:hypothetical protein